MEVIDKIIRAYRIFLTLDAYLLHIDANERSITHRFAIYLQNEFSEYNVDCEYNRNGIEPKRLDDFKKQTSSDDSNGTTVFPDIIVHHRGTEDNYIVIEAKKTSTKQKHISSNCTCDLCKMRMYKSELGYQYAYSILFPVAKDFNDLKDEYIDRYIQEI